MGRLKSIIKRFKADKSLLEKYDSIIQDQFNKGIIEKSSIDSVGLIHYIPHHPVITTQKITTKVRIVYDASAKTRKENLSLNECLYRGPVILEDLVAILMRFRFHKIGFVSDIEKAFLQIGLQDHDRDVTRFLWLKNPNDLETDNNLQVYRFTRVPFGVISSPFLLSATVAYHLSKENSAVAKQIKKDIYVDNVITGVDTISQAKDFYHQAKSIFSNASMNLREWNSNSKEFLSFVPQSDRSSSVEQKVLGLKWNLTHDLLFITIPELDSNYVVTKRFILKTIASIFDPLGLISPLLVQAKLFIQSLWEKGLNWHTVLEE